MKYLPLLLIALLFAGCSTDGFDKDSTHSASHSRPRERRTVKTTAYCHVEDGNRSNAIGGRLQAGNYYSASADWSRYPLGTRFRIVETGRNYIIDDYGSALVGTGTIDLYAPTMREMRNWGVRRVQIDILQWGSYERSLEVLRPRARRGYIRKMVGALEQKTS